MSHWKSASHLDHELTSHLDDELVYRCYIGNALSFKTFHISKSVFSLCCSTGESSIEELINNYSIKFAPLYNGINK